MNGRIEELGTESPVMRVMAATDRSATAGRAVRWAANLASRHEAELLLVQVMIPAGESGTQRAAGESMRADYAQQELTQMAESLAGPRGKAQVVMSDDPAAAIVAAAEEAGVDTLVVGNVGMSGRKKFLLDNVPNKVSHHARCNVVIVNTDHTGTPLRTATAAGIEPDIEAETEPRLMSRASEITAVMAKHGLKELFLERADDDDAAQRARARRLVNALEELGPTFAKLGQVLSTRPDLLPPAFIEELAALQDHCPPLAETEVVALMEEELGVPWEDVFESIDPEAMAAGTIAQVHRATLEDGSRVVVKIQRPTARDDIMQDLALLGLFAEKTEHRHAFRHLIDMPAVFEHLSESLQRELDFRTEAHNVERMRDALAPYPRLDVPGVHGDLSTARLLVLEEIQGIAVREAPQGTARKEAARQLLESYYAQILSGGFFHADPHPGNLMWWNDRIYFLDFGMVGELGPDLRQNLTLLLLAFWQGDVGFLTDVTLMLAGDTQRSDLDVDRFREELGALMARYRNVPLQEIQLGPILQEMTEISIRHDVPLPASLTLAAKAMAQMQLTAAELDPELDAFEVAGSFLMRTMVTRLRDKIDPKWMFYESQKVRVRLIRLIEALERLTGARPGPKLQVNFRAEELEETIRHAGRRLSLGIAAGAAILGSARTATTGRTPKSISVALATLGGALTARLLLDLLRRGE